VPESPLVAQSFGKSTSTVKNHIAAEAITLGNDNASILELSDGAFLPVLLAWHPRWSHRTEKERRNWRLIGASYDIHRLDLGEDMSIEGFLAGRP